MNYQVWESTDNSGEFETMRKVQKRMIMIAASFRLSWDWKSIIGMRDTSWRDDGTPLNMGCRVNKHDTFHRSILEIKCPLVFTKFIYTVSWRKHAYTKRLLFISSTTEAFFFSSHGHVDVRAKSFRRIRRGTAGGGEASSYLHTRCSTGHSLRA